MSDTQLIKDKIDIADLVGEYVQLKPAGVNKKGLCPFHHEKSPSFMVNRERQSWHCFGCAKGGDIFSFIEEIEGMEFVEALKFLANRAGVPLTAMKSDVNASQKNRIKDVNREAARFFYHFLLKMPAALPARAYLERRGVLPQTIDLWQIGFIPDQWDLLTQYLLKKGYGIDDLVASGLTIRRDGADEASGRGFYDRFRGRVMFPIWDVHGTVVGFTGRVLVETEHSGGKYVNTPQTLVYDKSRVVFGLNYAKQEIKRKNLIVMVEGQMDVIACHQAGMANVVATSGTALTDEQVRLLKRYATEMALAFDADAAGIAAAKRGIDIAMSEGMNLKVIRIPEGAGKDPDECIKLHPQVWFDAVGNAEDIMEWYFTKSFRGKDAANPRHKQQIADELLPDIARIPYAVERDHWLRELAGKIGVDVGVLKEDMVRLGREQKRQGAHPASPVSPTPAAPPEKTRIDFLAERLLVILLRRPAFGAIDDFPPELAVLLSTPDHRALYEFFRERYTVGAPINPLAMRNAFVSGDKENLIDTLLMQGDLLFGDLDDTQLKKEYALIFSEIKKEWKKNRLTLLKHEIEEADKTGDTAGLTRLSAQFESLR
jgi:DNA primase